MFVVFFITFSHLHTKTIDEMSLLDDLRNASQSKLRRTTTRVTNSVGQMAFESKSDDGTFQICGQSTDTNTSFMEIHGSPDEKLHYVIEGVYIGSEDSAANLTALTECKITHILNVAIEVKNAFPEQYEYLNIELLDIPQQNIRQMFSRTNEFIKQVIANNGRVLIHCSAGISRSSTIVLAYLLGIERMNYDDAYTLLKTARPVIRPNIGFVQQLKEYAAEIRQ